MGDSDPNDQWTNAGVHCELPELTAIDCLHLPCDCVQQIRNQLPDLLQGCHPDSFKTVLGVWISAAQALLPSDMVHGRFGSHFNCYYYYGHCSAVREEQEL